MNRNPFSHKDIPTVSDPSIAVVFEGLESRLLLAAAPTFGTDLATLYALNGDGLGLTLGIDGDDADPGDTLEISVTADDDTGLFWTIYDQTAASANQYAVMHFDYADGSAMGDIVVQLFETRAPLAAARFITLSENYITPGGQIEAPTVDNPAFYTDVDVHRVIDEFMFQTGDAVNGDGTGGSPLGDFANDTDDDLSFFGRGVLAMANRGADTNDSQWFITDAITSSLNGAHPIFGQIISGWDVYDTIMGLETDGGDRPLQTPILTSVDIVDSNLDGTITFVADDTFVGPAAVTVTLTDSEGHTVEQIITIMPEPSVTIPQFDPVPGETTEVQLDITYAGVEPLVFTHDHSPGADPIIAINPDTHIMSVTMPADYDGGEFELAVVVDQEAFANNLASNLTGNDLLSFGNSIGADWFDVVTVQTLLPTLPTLDDVEADAGDTVHVEIDIDYAGDRDLDVQFTTTGYPGGELTLPAPAAPADGDPWILDFDLPGDYDGSQFTLTVSAQLDGVDVIAPDTQSFQVSGVTPVIAAIDDITVVGDAAKTVQFDITYDGDHTMVVTATTDYNNGGVLTLNDPTADGDTYTLTLDMPAEYDRGEFTVTIEAAIEGHEALTQTKTFTVSFNQRPSVLNEQLIELIPGGAAQDELLLIIDPEGLPSSDLSVVITTDEPGVDIDDITFDETTSIATFQLPADLIGIFQITITTVESEYVDNATVEPTVQTFYVSTLGDRPTIANPDLFVAPGGTVTLALDISDENLGEIDYVIDAATDGFDVAVEVDQDTHELTITTGENVTGPFEITVTIIEDDEDTDGILTPSTHTFTVDVVAIQAGVLTPGLTTSLPVTIPYDNTDDLTLIFTPNYDGPGSVTLTYDAPAEEGGAFTLNVTLPPEYDGSPFTVSASATLAGIDMTPVTWTIAMATGPRPRIVDPGATFIDPGATAKRIPIQIAGDSGEAVTIGVLNPTPAPGVTVSYDAGTKELVIATPTGFAGDFTVTVTAVETAWADDCPDVPPSYTTFTVSNSFGFVSLLPDEIVLPADGRGITLGVDAWAPNGERVTITVSSSGRQLKTYSTSSAGNRFAELVFTEEDGTEIGTILVELFEGRNPEGAERFITLAANEVIRTAWDLDGDAPEYELDEEGTPFYTDVPVHRVIPGFMIQTGDATEGDGTGWTGMESIEENFGPRLSKPGNLSFAGRGVLAYANAGPGSSNGQFFITDQPATFLNDGYVIFGQVISGWDAYDSMINRSRNDDDLPDQLPILAGVNIIEDNLQDGSITLTPTKRFGGPATVTVTLRSASGETVTHEINVTRASKTTPTIQFGGVVTRTIAAGAVVDIPLVATYNGFHTPQLDPDPDYDGDGEVEIEIIEADGDNYTLRLTLPDGYDGEAFDITVTANLLDFITGNVRAGAPSTATLTVYPTGEITLFPNNVSGGVVFESTEPFGESIPVTPGEFTEFDFAIDYDGDEPLNVSVVHDFAGDGRISAAVSPTETDGIYSVLLTASADYDGSAFSITITTTPGGHANASIYGFVLNAGFNARPRISDPGLVDLDPSDSDTLVLTITDDDTDDLEVTASSGDPSVTTEIVKVVDPDTGLITYELTVTTLADFDGIVAVTVAAIESEYDALYGSLAPAERIIYVSGLGDRPTLDVDTIYADAGTHIRLGVDFVDDDGLPMVYTISTNYRLAIAELTGVADNPFQLTLPEGFFGTLEVTLTAVEDDPLAADALTPTSITLPVIITPTGANAPDVGVIERLQPVIGVSAPGQTSAVVRDGNLLFVGHGVMGLKVYKLQPDETWGEGNEPAGVYSPSQGFSGFVEDMDVYRVLDVNTVRTFVLLSNQSNLTRIEVNADGTLGTAKVVNALAYDTAILNGRAYVASGSLGLISYDVSDPDTFTAGSYLDRISGFAPTQIERWKYQFFPQSKALWTYLFQDVRSVEIRGNFAYVAESIGDWVFTGSNRYVRNPGSEGWVGIVDIRQPNNLKAKGKILTREQIRDIDIQGNRLYLLGESKLSVYSLAASRPKRLGRMDVDNGPVSITVANTTAVLTSYAGFEFVDVANPRHMDVDYVYHVLSDLYAGYNGLDPLPASFGGADLYLPTGDNGVLRMDANSLVRDDILNITGRKKFWLDDTAVTVSITGGGHVDVYLADFDPRIEQIHVVGGRPNTVVTIKTGASRTVEVDAIDIDGPIRAFGAKTTTLLGDFNAAGPIANLKLGDVGAPDLRREQSLTIANPEGLPPNAAVASNITLGNVYDLRLNCGVPITTLKAIRWLDNEADGADIDGVAFPDTVDIITAPQIKTLSIKGKGKSIVGDFQADLALSGEGVTDVFLLKNAKIKGSLTDSLWDIDGNVKNVNVAKYFTDSQLMVDGGLRSVTVGAMVRSEVYAGYVGDTAAVTGVLPTSGELLNPGTFDPTGYISNVLITGFKVNKVRVDAFVDSNIAAASLGKIGLKYAQLDNDDDNAATNDAFGLTTKALTRLIYKDANGRTTWRTPDLGELTIPGEPSDLIVRIV